MFKNLFFTSFFLLSLIGLIYPSKKENTKLFDYCYSLEKILSRHSIQKRNKESLKTISISNEIANLGLGKTRGLLINKVIDEYKNSKNYFIIKVVPNKFYCFAGYWIEKKKPGTFESILYAKSKKVINEFKDYKDEVNEILKDINSKYKNIKKDFNTFF